MQRWPTCITHTASEMDSLYVAHDSPGREQAIQQQIGEEAENSSKQSRKSGMEHRQEAEGRTADQAEEGHGSGMQAGHGANLWHTC